MSEHRIKSYNEGQQDERDAIRAWIEDNRTFVEFDAGDGVWREHASFQELLDFLDSRK